MKQLAIVITLGLVSLSQLAHADYGQSQHGDRRHPGAVFTSSNEHEGNRVLAFAIGQDGTLTEPIAYATQGLGSGDSLGSQGALVLSDDQRFLLVVNAGSNEISSFAVSGARLSLRDRVSSAGMRPISITERDGLVFVLNAGEPNNVAGFYLDRRGKLTPQAQAPQALSAALAGPAQVELSPDGEHLVVSEKTTNKLTTFEVGSFGRLRAANVQTAAGTTPFGFEFTSRGTLIVSEAASASLSAYAFARRGNALITLSAAVPDTQAAPCWVAISADDRVAFTANAGSASISSYDIARSGEITLKDATAGELGPGGRPLDLAFGRAGSYLYALDRGNGSIAGFELARDGTLTPLLAAGMLPAFTSGLAAY